MKTISSVNLPQECWIHENKRFVLRGKTFPSLPFVDLEYECILKSNGIPYRKTLKVSDGILYFKSKEVCEYWNPEVRLKEEEISLPLFAKLPNGSYSYCGKNYSQRVITYEAFNSVTETVRFVTEEINKYEQILREVFLYRFAKEKLAGGIATVCLSTDTPDTSIYYEIHMNHDNFKILRIWGRTYYLDWVAIFDMNKISPNGYISLQVPKHIAGWVIGRNGTNIQAWAEEIGVKRIQIVPI